MRALFVTSEHQLVMYIMQGQNNKKLYLIFLVDAQNFLTDFIVDIQSDFSAGQVDAALRTSRTTRMRPAASRVSSETFAAKKYGVY